MKIYTVIPAIFIYLFFIYGMERFVEQERERLTLQDKLLQDIEK